MKNYRKYYKLLGIIMILVSIGLLLREMIQYNSLPSMDDPISEVVDFFKYKENAITNGIIWIIFLILGILFIKTKRKY